MTSCSNCLTLAATRPARVSCRGAPEAASTVRDR